MGRGSVFTACLPKSAGHSGVPEKRPPLDMHRCMPMSLVQLYMPLEAAQTTLTELGESGLVQFRDLNEEVPAFQKHFTAEIVQLTETERKIESLTKAAEAAGVLVKPWQHFLPPTLQMTASRSTARILPKTQQELLEMDRELGEYEERVLEMDEGVGTLERRLEDLEEYRAVLLQVSQILTGSSVLSESGSESEPGDEESGAGNSLSGHTYHRIGLPRTMTAASASVRPSGFVVGVIGGRKFTAFERVMWRAMHGNCYIGNAALHIQSPAEGGNVSSVGVGVGIDAEGDKSLVDDSRMVFVVFGHGVAALNKIQRICQALGCHLYPDVNENVSRRSQQLANVSAQIDDLMTVLYNTRLARKAELSKVGGSLEEQLAMVRHQRALYVAMNLMHHDAGRRCLIAEAWCPTGDIGRVDEALHRSGERAGLDVSSIMTVLKTELTPPTFFPRNRFTAVFQDITEAYGVGAYREANPALSMIITFPFFFAIMFGDVGHALVVLLIAIWMVVAEKQLARRVAGSEMAELVFSARYIILLMGVFSMFTGLVYNDFLSKSMAWFPSMFIYNAEDGTSTRIEGQVYPFGFDPLWNHAANNLNFTNAVKMKMAIVLAVLHMDYALILGATNYAAQGDMAGLLCSFLPQFLFFNGLFGYMAFMIVCKWCTGADVPILTTFITMLMGLGAVDEKYTLYDGQQLVQTVLVLMVLGCVPWMIFGRALMFLARKRRLQALGYHETSRHGSGDSLSTVVKKTDPLVAVDLSEGGRETLALTPESMTSNVPAANGSESVESILVHDAIHAIEFTLGSVSNTASYLRLWALSLAHSQLSEVLWTFCVDACAGNPILLVIGYFFFFVFSLALMVAMEGLSAFLHALRLHWVEFNNKFYRGTGIKYEPFLLDPVTGEGCIIAAAQPVDY